MAAEMEVDHLPQALSLSDDSEGDSDEELQQAFASGHVKPGLNRVIEKETKVFINKVPEMQEKINEIRLEMEWLERLDVTTSHSQKDSVKDESENANKDSHDDFKREMRFYKQAQMAVAEVLPKLARIGMPIVRPDDYFAEMVKSDDHMQKVREKLVVKERVMEKSEKAKKLRAMKKFGKKVQHEVIQKRQQEKKRMLESVKKIRKGKKGKPEFNTQGDDEFQVSTETGMKRKAGKQTGKSFKRQRKDVKYGFGGKKRSMKKNTADSTNDITSFSSAKHSNVPRGKRQKTTKNKRLGKSRRNATKHKGS